MAELAISVVHRAVDDQKRSARMPREEIPPEVNELGRVFRKWFSSYAKGTMNPSEWTGMCVLFLKQLGASEDHSWAAEVIQEVGRYADANPDPEKMSRSKLRELLTLLFLQSWDTYVARPGQTGTPFLFQNGCGQSLPTALLIQQLLGGYIWRHEEADSDRAHFSNQIWRRDLDLIRKRRVVAVRTGFSFRVPIENLLKESFTGEQDVTGRYALLRSRFIVAAAAMARCCACPPSSYTSISVKEERPLSS